MTPCFMLSDSKSYNKPNSFSLAICRLQQQVLVRLKIVSNTTVPYSCLRLMTNGSTEGSIRNWIQSLSGLSTQCFTTFRICGLSLNLFTHISCTLSLASCRAGHPSCPLQVGNRQMSSQFLRASQPEQQPSQFHMENCQQQSILGGLLTVSKSLA